MDTRLTLSTQLDMSLAPQEHVVIYLLVLISHIKRIISVTVSMLKSYDPSASMSIQMEVHTNAQPILITDSIFGLEEF